MSCMTLCVHICGVKKRKLESWCGKWLEMEKKTVRRPLILWNNYALSKSDNIPLSLINLYLFSVSCARS